MVFNQWWLARFQPSTLSTPSSQSRVIARPCPGLFRWRIQRRWTNSCCQQQWSSNVRWGKENTWRVNIQQAFANNFCPYKLMIIILQPEFSGHFGIISPKVAGLLSRCYRVCLPPPPSHSHPPIPLQNVRFKNLKLFRFPFKSSFPKFNQLQRNDYITPRVFFVVVEWPTFIISHPMHHLLSGGSFQLVSS